MSRSSVLVLILSLSFVISCNSLQKKRLRALSPNLPDKAALVASGDNGRAVVDEKAEKLLGSSNLSRLASSEAEVSTDLPELVSGNEEVIEQAVSDGC